MSDLLAFGVIAPLGIVGVFFLLVVIHELGHYAVGRIFGLGITEFSIGFGPKLFSRFDSHGTAWCLRALPLGGFVKFVGDDDATSRPDPQASAMEARIGALACLPLGKRALVVAAGPLANFLLAFALFTVQASLVGQINQAPVIALVAPGSVAEAAGLRPGDRVQRAAGRSIETFAELNLVFERHLGEELTLEVTPGDLADDLAGDPASDLARQVTLRPTAGLGQSFGAYASGLQPVLTPQVLEVADASPAAAMGLRVGDKVLGYDGEPLASLTAFAQARLAKVGQPMTLLIERAGKPLTLVGTPQMRLDVIDGRTVRSAGFGFQIGFPRQRLGLTPAMAEAFATMQQFSYLIFKLPGQFISQQRNLDDLGGPVRIAETVGQVAVATPLVLLFLAGLLSLQLGLINLFPIPVLDGGHLLLYGAEAVIRRPLPPRLVMWLYRLGTGLLLSFFLVVTLNDLARFIF